MVARFDWMIWKLVTQLPARYVEARTEVHTHIGGHVNRALKGAGVGLAAVPALAACGTIPTQGPAPTVTVTNSPTAVPTTAPVETPPKVETPTPTDTPSELSDLAFVQMVNQEIPSSVAVPDQQLIDVGHLICDGIDSGLGLLDIVSLAVDAGFSQEDGAQQAG